MLKGLVYVKPDSKEQTAAGDHALTIAIAVGSAETGLVTVIIALRA